VRAGSLRLQPSSASLCGLLGSDSPYRVLIAEDDDAFLDALETVLELNDGVVVAGRARNGEEAVELAGRLDPDLVVMDIEMPVLDGVEATRILHERMPDVPVVAISGHDYEERVLEIRHAGASDYVRKARLEEELPAVVAALLSGQRQGVARDAGR